MYDQVPASVMRDDAATSQSVVISVLAADDVTLVLHDHNGRGGHMLLSKKAALQLAMMLYDAAGPFTMLEDDTE